MVKPRGWASILDAKIHLVASTSPDVDDFRLDR